jgi:hypothetical protein
MQVIRILNRSEIALDNTRNKSLFASFSSEKEESCSFLKKRTKRLLLPGVGLRDPGLGRRVKNAQAGSLPVDLATHVAT